MGGSILGAQAIYSFLNKKIKKQDGLETLSLEPTTDILAHLGKTKQHQLLIGFALESHNAIENAKQKLSRKNLDAIVVNSLEDNGAGFGYDTNKISFLQPEKEAVHYSLKSKEDVAEDIIIHLKTMLNEH